MVFVSIPCLWHLLRTKMIFITQEGKEVGQTGRGRGQAALSHRELINPTVG